MERELLAKARRGDADAFSALLSPLSGMVYRHCLQMLRQPADAEDAAQEAMLKAYRSLPGFIGQSHIATWLFRIAHNTCLDILKKPGRVRENTSLEALQDAGADWAGREEAPDAAYVRSAEAERLQRATQKLPQDQQLLLNLRYGEQMSYEELARTCGLREGTVKSKLSRAKEKLKALLAEEL